MSDDAAGTMLRRASSIVENPILPPTFGMGSRLLIVEIPHPEITDHIFGFSRLLSVERECTLAGSFHCCRRADAEWSRARATDPTTTRTKAPRSSSFWPLLTLASSHSQVRRKFAFQNCMWRALFCSLLKAVCVWSLAHKNACV